jgi:superfamily II DNA/RNA helicase
MKPGRIKILCVSPTRELANQIAEAEAEVQNRGTLAKCRNAVQNARAAFAALAG